MSLDTSRIIKNRKKPRKSLQDSDAVDITSEKSGSEWENASEEDNDDDDDYDAALEPNSSAKRKRTNERKCGDTPTWNRSSHADRQQFLSATEDSDEGDEDVPDVTFEGGLTIPGGVCTSHILEQ